MNKTHTLALSVKPTLTRSLVSAVLACALLASLNSPAQASSCDHPFSDLKGHWAEEEVCELYTLGVVNGVSEKNFDPDGDITRAEFVKILTQSLSYTISAVQSAAFTDTHPSDWFYAVVSFARSKGIVSGYSDGSFRPNNSLTRAEALEVLMKASGYSSSETQDLNHQFYDVSGRDWFADSLALALEYDLIEGYGDGSFRPNSEISRAEACALLSKALKSIL